MSVIVVTADCTTRDPQIVGFPEDEQIEFKELNVGGLDQVQYSCSQIIAKCRRLARRCERRRDKLLGGDGGR